MSNVLIPNTKLYKANLHVHTNISDGTFSPEEIKKRYKEKGYSIVAYTDHDVFVCHNDLTDDDFLAINAHEEEINESPDRNLFYSYKTYHFNFYAKDKDTLYSPVFSEERVWSDNAKKYVTDEMRKNQVKYAYNQSLLNTIIERANKNGFMVSYNHPVWSCQDSSDYSDLKGLWGIEVYNHDCFILGQEDNSKPLDHLLRKGENPYPLCTDDAHSDNDMFGGYLMVWADKLEYSAVINSLTNGNFYSSYGATIKSLKYENGKFTIEVGDDTVKVAVISGMRYTKAYRNSDSKCFTNAVIDINSGIEEIVNKKVSFDKIYYRIEVTNSKGQKAFTRAYRLSELETEK